MDSNKGNNMNDKNKDGIIDILAKELEKRKEIKEQSKIIRGKIDDIKQQYIQTVEDKYKSRSKKIDENNLKLSDAINTGNVKELQDVFNRILDDMNN